MIVEMVKRTGCSVAGISEYLCRWCRRPFIFESIVAARPKFCPLCALPAERPEYLGEFVEGYPYKRGSF